MNFNCTTMEFISDSFNKNVQFNGTNINFQQALVNDVRRTQARMLGHASKTDVINIIYLFSYKYEKLLIII